MKHHNITFAQKNIAFEYALKQQGIMKQQGLYGIYKIISNHITTGSNIIYR